MAKLKRPAGPNSAPTYEPPKPKRPPKRTHGTAKDHQAAKRRAQKRRGQQADPSSTDPSSADPTLDETQLIKIANDKNAYYQSLVSPQFGGMSSNPYITQYLEGAQERADQGYYNARLLNPDLHYASYMQSLGAGGGAGQLGALGTGQAGQVDTGNPFTSSSGIGAPPSVPTAAGALPTLGKRPNRQQHPNQLANWKKKKKRQGQPGVTDPATLGQIGINPMAVGTGYTDQLRRGFLSLSPMERGDVALGKTMIPGKWSPWG